MNRDGRYAPSPTGDLHLGNLRTALLAWLIARSACARFVVRVEDLDRGRVRAGVADRQLADLAAIGVDWDGEVVAQSARGPLYDEAIERLERAGLVYECFCTRREVREAASAPHGPGPEGAYPGTCRHLPPAEREARRAADRRPSLRLRAEEERVGFTDRLLGPQAPTPVDDFVLRRADGAVAYNLAVVVDDAAQDIGEVVRGADLAETTPRQLLLARRLGYAVPHHAHVPLVLGPDGAWRAERHGAVTLRDVPAQAAVTWMAASLGQPTARSAPELLDGFAVDRLPREPAVYPPEGRAGGIAP